MVNQTEDKKPLTVQELAAMGGKARARGMTKKRRKEIASAAARARWGDKEGKKEKPGGAGD